MDEVYLSDCAGDSITVGMLKELLKKLPDDMPVIRFNGDCGQDDELTFAVEDDPECRKVPTLIIF